jgi:3-deoxy-manno-octulosonate cytidylyltransferase (CMP-KDO synthetase)
MTNNSHSYLVVIPARMASTRLPNKPMVDIAGKTMIQRTCEQTVKAVSNESLMVATDDHRIKDHLESLGYHVMMTSDACLTGTDRVAEVASKTTYDYYINVQGDEPLINPDDIQKVIDQISVYPGEIINGYTPIDSEDDYRSLSVPKVIFRPDGRLMYMSRAPIPGNKQGNFRQSWRQICIYAFPRQALAEFAAQREKTMLEALEDIEILRFMEMGYDVRMVELSNQSIAVDNPKDVDKVIQRLNEGK